MASELQALDHAEASSTHSHESQRISINAAEQATLTLTDLQVYLSGTENQPSTNLTHEDGEFPKNLRASEQQSNGTTVEEHSSNSRMSDIKLKSPEDDAGKGSGASDSADLDSIDSNPNEESSKSQNRRGKSAKKETKLDTRSKLEKSRQSARECRARKKLRYQYLEDLVCNREKAVVKLREELTMFCEMSRRIDIGIVSEEDRRLLVEQAKENSEY